MDDNSACRENLLTIIGVTVAVIVTAVVVWLDIKSGLWQELVILSGIVAGLVTFLLTVLVIDRVIAKSTAKRWAPVNRLALSEFLHALADDEYSEVSKGMIVPRSFARIEPHDVTHERVTDLEDLRERVYAERTMLSDVLSRWAQFLASSGDNEIILRHIAHIALVLDTIRDTALEAEETGDTTALADVNNQIDRVNEGFASLCDELRESLAQPTS